MKKLYLLDASGYLYRSYFAIRNITNARGESTNALFGFIRSLLKLRKDFHPEYLVAVFDGPSSIQHREAMYVDYKAHRKAMPADLSYQIKWAQQACELMGIPYLAVTGVEADDTMGTIAVWAAQQGDSAYLCTSDKDLYQLVNDHIFILNTFKENQILGAKEVVEAFGVTPKQMVDYLAITGDASDNVPGLPGFGPKTASALLQEFGTLDHILENPEVVSGKKKEILIQHADQARLSRKLVTIHPDVPFTKDWAFFKIQQPDLKPLKEFYASMNFTSLIRELEMQQQPGIPPTQVVSDNKPVEYHLVDDPASLTALFKHLKSSQEVAVSVVASDPLPFRAELIGIAFSTNSHLGWYIPTNGKLGLDNVLSGLKDLFESKTVGFFGHNIKFDMQVLLNYGVAINRLVFDTMLASYLLNSHHRQHSLDHLMLERCGKLKMPMSDILGKGKTAITMLAVPLEQMSSCACEAADYSFRLKELLEPQLKERNLLPLMMDLELPLVPVLTNMERHGIYVDIPYLTHMSHDIQEMIHGLEQEIYELAGENFNINSPKQLSEILFTKMGIKPPKKTATGLSTSAEVLEVLRHDYPLAGKIVEYRTLEKLRSTYIDSLPLEVNPKTHRIHCTFNQSVAATGRLSCQDPNLQNIPIRNTIGRKIRGAFRPEKPDWSFLAADYSQIELRLLAHLSEDPLLIQAFERGEDIHASTASYVFNLPLDQVTKEIRNSAKAVNFGVIYGQQAYGLSQVLGIPVHEAATFIDTYFQRFKRVKEFVEECKEMARQTGRAVTYTGRERLIPEIHSKNMQIRAAAERLAINTPLQGTAADLIKIAMLRLDAQLKKDIYRSYAILQIHDELIFEVPDEEVPAMEKLVRDTMQGVLKLKVPLIVDVVIGKNWSEC